MLPKSTRLLFLDTLPILRLLEFHPDYYPVLSSLLDKIYEKNIPMIVTPLSLTEISSRAFQQGQAPLARQYYEFFTRSRLLRLHPIDAATALEAARLHAKFGMGTTEALQLAASQLCGADLLLTGNGKWREWCDSEVLTLDELLQH